MSLEKEVRDASLISRQLSKDLRVSGASHIDGWGKSEAEKQETQRPLAEISLIGMERRPMGLKRAHGRKQG